MAALVSQASPLGYGLCPPVRPICHRSDYNFSDESDITKSRILKNSMNFRLFSPNVHPHLSD